MVKLVSLHQVPFLRNSSSYWKTSFFHHHLNYSSNRRLHLSNFESNRVRQNSVVSVKMVPLRKVHDYYLMYYRDRQPRQAYHQINRLLMSSKSLTVAFHLVGVR